MRKWMSLMTVVSLVSLVALGCGTGNEVGEGTDTDHDHGAELTLASFEKVCGDCGHGFNGEGHECDTEHEACEKCGVHEGSLLCCAGLEETAGKAFCAKCGQVAGSEVCCAEGAEVCEKCGLHKGSDLCCKVASEGEADHDHADHDH